MVLNRSQTEKSFGDKWNSDAGKKYGLSTQEKESLLEQLLSILGTKELSNVLCDGANVLDIGCGPAWAESLFNTDRSVNWFAVDISSSVFIAHKRTKTMNNVTVLQADLSSLPFSEKFFDVIFANGVLHHTKNASKSFSILCSHLKVGGLVGIYVYCKKPFIRELVDKEVRKITTQMSFEECTEFSKQISKLGEAFLNTNCSINVDDIPMLNIKKGTYNLQKFIYDHFIKCFFKKDLEFSTMVNVDWYHPKNVSFHTKREIEFWFANNNVENVKFIQPSGYEYSGYFVSGRKSK